MNLTASLWERYEAQRAERLRTGRPLQTGDLVHEPGMGFRTVVAAASAGDCIDATVAKAIRGFKAKRSEEGHT
jgi:hypothetical protein